MDFWNRLEKLIEENEIMIDRPKGSTHPKFDNFTFPLDYGYLKNTSSNDGNEIDIWKGSLISTQLIAIACTVDSMKKDSEIKLFVGCSSDEIEILIDFYDNNMYMSGMFINNPLYKTP